MRAPNSGRKLTDSDAALVKAMIAGKDRQHDIAAVFAVNGGRIGETSTGEHFSKVAPASSGLPPKAPYLVIDAKYRARVKTLQVELLAGKFSGSGKKTLDDLLEAFEESHILRQGK